MNEQYKRDAVLRFLSAYPPINSVRGLNSICDFILSIFSIPKEETARILEEFRKEGLVSMQSGNQLINSREGAFFARDDHFKITKEGIDKAALITNRAILDIILADVDKDKILLPLALKHINIFSKEIHRGYIVQAINNVQQELSEDNRKRICDGYSAHRLFSFLKDNGLIIQADEKNYQLTKRGKKLIKLGNYDSLLKWEHKSSIDKQQKKELENKLLKEQSDFQELSNVFIGKQSKLIDNQITTNNNVKTTNRRVLIILMVTVLVAIINIIPPAIALKRDIDRDTAKDTTKQYRNTIKSLELRLQKEERKSDSLFKILERAKH